jgi:hypothetical protein
MLSSNDQGDISLTIVQPSSCGDDISSVASIQHVAGGETPVITNFDHAIVNSESVTAVEMNISNNSFDRIDRDPSATQSSVGGDLPNCCYAAHDLLGVSTAVDSIPGIKSIGIDGSNGSNDTTKDSMDLDVIPESRSNTLDDLIIANENDDSESNPIDGCEIY